METALITVGDELLAGDTENTNATWLVRRLDERGVSVARILVVPDDRDAIAERVRAYREDYDAVIVERRLAELDGAVPDLDLDPEAEASIPEGSRPLVNAEGLAPGCVIENVYVLPGIPGEMKAMFADVADAFEGDADSRVLYTTEPEANVAWALEEVRERFEVRVGCYPDREAGHNRLKLRGENDDALAAAATWLLEAVDASETPVERDWDPGAADEGT